MHKHTDTPGTYNTDRTEQKIETKRENKDE